jgi:hypothetical protein
MMARDSLRARMERASILLSERMRRRTARANAKADAMRWIDMWVDNGNPVSLRKAISILEEENEITRRF